MDTRSLTPFLLIWAGSFLLAVRAEKRAVPQYIPRHNNVTASRNGQCPDGQLPQKDRQNNTVCCWPTACTPGHSIATCSWNGGEDICRKCEPGYLQPNSISSANMTQAQCFKYNKRQHDKCPSDTKNSTEMFNSKCSLWCVCDSDKCYHGDPCLCDPMHPPCGVNEEFDPLKKKCVECQWYAFKHVNGCQQCEINVTRWRLGKQHTEGPIRTIKTTTLSTTVTRNITDKQGKSPDTGEQSSAEEVEQEKEVDSNNSLEKHIVIAVSIVLSVLILGGFTVCFLWRRSISSTSLVQPDISVLGSLLNHCLPRKPNENTASTVSTPLSEQSALLDADFDETDKKDVDHVEATSNLEIIQEVDEVDTRALNEYQTLYVRRQNSDHEERSENMRMVKHKNPTEFGRQNSFQVDAEIHSSSSSGSPSDLEETDITPPQTPGSRAIHGQAESLNRFSGAAGKTAVTRGIVVAKNAQPVRTGGQVQKTDRAVSVQGSSLATDDVSESHDTGIDVDSSLTEADLYFCRAENVSVEPSSNYRRTGIDAPEQPLDTRVVLGESRHSSTTNLTPLKLTMPSAPDSLDKSVDQSPSVSSPVVQSPVGQSPRIVFDNPRRNLPVVRVEPLQRETELHYASGSGQSSTNLNSSNNSASDITSYVYHNGQYNSGPSDIAHMSDLSSFNGPSSYSYPRNAFCTGQMTSDSNNNSYVGRVNPASYYFDGRNDPDGASFVRTGSRETESLGDTEVKEVVPESDEFHQTSLKFVDRDDTCCKTVEVNPVEPDVEYKKLKLIEEERVDTRPANTQVHTITENSSSVAGGDGSVNVKTETAVMEEEDSNINGLACSGNVTKEAPGSGAGTIQSSIEEFTSARAVLSAPIADCDIGGDSSVEISQFVNPAAVNDETDQESLELPNSAIDQYEST